MIIIRKARLTDAKSIAMMHASSFIASLKLIVSDNDLASIDSEGFCERWAVRIVDQTQSVYIAKDKNKIVGVIDFMLQTNQMAEIMLLYVHPNYWRKGIGKRLMRYTMRLLSKQKISKIKIWALKKNSKARAFYESQGAYSRNTMRRVRLSNINLIEVLYYLKINDHCEKRSINHLAINERHKKVA